MNKAARRAIFVTMTLCFVCQLYACGNNQTSDSKKPRTAVERKKPVAVKLPDNFPKDVPIYKPSMLTEAEVYDNGTTAAAALIVQDEASKVNSFYKKTVPENGWTIEGKLHISGVLVLQGKKDDIALNVVVEEGETETSVALSRGKEK